MSEKKSKKGQKPVYDYQASLHFGICHGPVDALVEVRVKDKTAWPGSGSNDGSEEALSADYTFAFPKFGTPAPGQKSFAEILNSPGDTLPYFSSKSGTKLATQQEILSVTRPNLFAGDEKSGGVRGWMEWLPGNALQKLSERAAARLKLTPDTAPGYRGIASIFFGGSTSVRLNPDGNATDLGGLAESAIGSDEVPGDHSGTGFVWGSNDPYMPTVSARVLRRPRAFGLLPQIYGLNVPEDQLQVLMIQRQDGDMPDANPAAIIYECLTNRVWGMGAPERLIDMDSFRRMARLLSLEKLGLSLAWTRQDSVKAFVREILDHISGALYVSPRTGKFTLRLIRSDAEMAKVGAKNFRSDFTATPSNCVLEKVERKSWMDTVNELNVTWTNPITGDEEVVTVQDLANISIQGRVVTDERNFYGVRNQDLAIELGNRELRTAGYPMARFELILSREAWDLEPCDTFILRYTDPDIAETLVRVMDIDYGKPGDRKIRVTAVEDVFARVSGEIVTGEPTKWQAPSAPSTLSRGYLTVAPASYVLSTGLVSNDDEETLQTTQVIPMALYSPGASAPDRIDLYSRKNANTTDEQYGFCAALPPAHSFKLGRPLAAEAHSLLAPSLDFTEATKTIRPQIGDFLVFVKFRDYDVSDSPYPTALLTGPHLDTPENRARLAGQPAVIDTGFGWNFSPGQVGLPDEDTTYFKSSTPRGSDTLTRADRVITAAYYIAQNGQDGWNSLYPEEWTYVEAVDAATGEIQIRRGIYDTTPTPIPAGVTVFHVPRFTSFADQSERDSGDFASYVPVLHNGHGARIDLKSSRNIRLDYRPHRPQRPAAGHVMIGATKHAFGSLTVDDLDMGITLRWYNRNRLLEDRDPMPWEERLVTPEAGQKTIIRIYHMKALDKGYREGTNGRVIYRVPYTKRGLFRTVYEAEFATGVWSAAIEPTFADGKYSSILSEPGVYVVEFSARRTHESGKTLECIQPHILIIRSGIADPDEPIPEDPAPPDPEAVGYGRNYGETYGG